MVSSRAADVDAYLAEVPEDRRTCLSTVRDVARRVLAGYDESMAYGMPTYGRGDDVRFSFASQKQHIALYVHPPVVAANADRLTAAGLDYGKSCLRFRRPEQIDLELVEALLRETAATDVHGR